jgi:hypothetical protein
MGCLRRLFLRHEADEDSPPHLDFCRLALDSSNVNQYIGLTSGGLPPASAGIYFFLPAAAVAAPALGFLVPYLLRLLLRFFTPWVSSEPRTMW